MGGRLNDDYFVLFPLVPVGVSEITGAYILLAENMRGWRVRVSVSVDGDVIVSVNVDVIVSVDVVSIRVIATCPAALRLTGRGVHRAGRGQQSAGRSAWRPFGLLRRDFAGLLPTGRCTR